MSAGAPRLGQLIPGATFVAVREGGNARAGFGGATGPDVSGRELERIGTPCGGPCATQLKSALDAFASSRWLIQVRANAVGIFPPQATTGRTPREDFLLAVGGSIGTAELAALYLWLLRYDLEGTYDAGPDGFDFLVRGEQRICDDPTQNVARIQTTRDVIRVARDGTITSRASTPVSTQPGQCVVHTMPLGRRPEGVSVPRSVESSAAYFAAAAQLEAISVPAFERLARELAHHGATLGLVSDARRAARDEARHAATMTALAREHGAVDGDVAPPAVRDLPVRSLFDVALENAVEGCVNETFAALVATFQAANAPEARLRAEMDVIARDETRHAELAWEIDAWCRTRLSQAECDALNRARERALDALASAVASAPSAPAVAGEPDAAVSAELVARLAGAILGHA